MSQRWEPGELEGQVADDIVERWRTMYDETNAEGLERTTGWFRETFLPQFAAEVEKALAARLGAPPA